MQFIATARRAEVDKVAEEPRGHRASLGARAVRRSARRFRRQPRSVEVKVESARPNNEVAPAIDGPQGLNFDQPCPMTSYPSRRLDQSENPMFDNRSLIHRHTRTLNPLCDGPRRLLLHLGTRSGRRRRCRRRPASMQTCRRTR